MTTFPLLADLRNFAVYVGLPVCLMIFVSSSLAQTPGSSSVVFPHSAGPAMYTLPIPSVLDDDPEDLYNLPKRGEGSSGERNTVVSEERGRQTSTSLSLSSGYDTAIDDIPHLGGEVILAEGAVAVLERKRAFNILLQHDFQFSDSHGTGVGMEQYQFTTASIIPTEYRRTMWSLLIENGYGSDSVRAAGTIAPSTITESPVPTVNVTNFGLVSGNILTDHGVFGVHRRLSRSRSAELQAGGYFHHFFAIGTSDQQYSLSGLISQRWSRAQTFAAKAEVVQEHYTTLDCTNGSLTLRSDTQITQNTRLEGGVGPVWGSASCSRTYEYNVTLTSETPRGNSYYIGSAREPANGFIEYAAWEESNFAGFSAGQPQRLMGRIDSGYSRYLIANPTPLIPDQQGYFLSGELRHRLSNTADVSFRARYFYSSGKPSNLNRSLFLLSYSWSREERPVRIRTLGGHNAPQ